MNYLVYGVLLGASVAASQFCTTTLRNKLGRVRYLEFRKRPVVRLLETVCTWIVSSVCIVFVGTDIIREPF
ncbi:MAG: hypothetical protein LBP35_04050 [Candidatus Ancillula trichonymphae]|nr:hypothetical protein [Candidatus Ancillula trichonymphae]